MMTVHVASTGNTEGADALRNHNLATEWWKTIRAQLNQYVPYTSYLQGDTPALVPFRPQVAKDDAFLKIFNQDPQAISDERHRNDYGIKPKVVKMGCLLQVLCQIQYRWSYDNYYMAASGKSRDGHVYVEVPDLQPAFEHGQYFFRLDGTGVRIYLPTTADVEAVTLNAFDAGEDELAEEMYS